MEPRRKWLALALGAVSALLIALSVPALVVPAQDSAGIAPASLEAARPDGDAFGSASAPSAEIDETAEETGGDGTGPQERPPASDVAAAAAAPSSGAASESPGAADGADGAPAPVGRPTRTARLPRHLPQRAPGALPVPRSARLR